MDELGVADNDHGSGTHLESEYWAVLEPELVCVNEEGLAGTSDLEEVADYWPSRWSRRKIEVFGFGFLGEQENEAGDEEC